MITVNDGSPSSLIFDLAGEDGSPQDVATLTVQFKNGTNVLLGTASPSFSSGDVEVKVTIPSNINTLTDASKSESRSARLQIVLTDGALKTVDQSYLVLSDGPISFMDRSYQTLQDAELVAHYLPKKDGWDSATDEQKTNALIAAFHSLGNFNYSVRTPDYYVSDTSIPSTINSAQYTVRRLNEKTPAFVASYPAVFLNAIKKAQVIEANSILVNNVIIDKRKDGLIEETVGESTMKWRNGKAVDLGLSRDTLIALSGFIEIGHSVGRS